MRMRIGNLGDAGTAAVTDRYGKMTHGDTHGEPRAPESRRPAGGQHECGQNYLDGHAGKRP